MLVLAKFDVREGHKVVWTSDDVPRDAIHGIEFEMLPSGLHEVAQDVVYFAINGLEGCAAYTAKVNEADPHDRSKHKVYALAALGERLPWAQEAFLEYELAKFLEFEDVALLPQTQGPPNPQSHAVLAAPDMAAWYGPMLFELWKAASSRTRLVLRSPLPVRDMSKFVYLVSRLGLIPADTVALLPQRRRAAASEYKCLYNVTLLDVATLQSTESFCATTTEDVLLEPGRDAYSVWADRDALHYVTGGTSGPTWRDRQRFARLAEHAGLAYRSRQPRWAAALEALADSTSRGGLWWAAAGDTSLLEDDELPELAPGEPAGVAVIGAFHNFTRQVVRVLATLAEDSDAVIVVGVEDMYAMGLDPMAAADRAYLERFALWWWDRPVRFRGCCCS